jgi:hypothetical protein
MLEKDRICFLYHISYLGLPVNSSKRFETVRDYFLESSWKRFETVSNYSLPQHNIIKLVSGFERFRTI